MNILDFGPISLGKGFDFIDFVVAEDDLDEGRKQNSLYHFNGLDFISIEGYLLQIGEPYMLNFSNYLGIFVLALMQSIHYQAKSLRCSTRLCVDRCC